MICDFHVEESLNSRIPACDTEWEQDDLCVQPAQVNTILKRLSYLSTRGVNVSFCITPPMTHTSPLI
ncbi:hypothetical protein E2C01_019898 [Portunus trituberculatus]|uniref:Uncharacterized protein n=1 Tax=Portunus trituberculatus TaxID=210409 RepID=A0A5B7DYP0_PORTR|nr:hypothetical protein [Portunus trituberculatus]